MQMVILFCARSNRDLNATSGICLITKHDLCFVHKTIPEIEISHLPVSSNNITSRINGLCIDEDVECFEQILLEDDELDKSACSSLNLPRMNVQSALIEDMTDSISSEDLKPSTLEGLGSFENVLEQNVSDKEISNPVLTYLHETSKPVMNDLISPVDNGNLAEYCYSGKNSAVKLPSEQIIEPKVNFSQELDTDYLQVDSSNHSDSTGKKQDHRGHFDQVSVEEKLTMASPTQAKECNQIEETVKEDFYEENKSSFSVTTSIKSNMLDPIKGASSDVDLEGRDILIAGNEIKVGNNQQNAQKRIGASAEDLIIDSAASAGSSFARLIHDDSCFSGTASLLGPTTSAHIPYSGNISHRSDSSTTSTQSFAFPILQSEWNSSPVKMAKADRRQLRKHRWRTILICCRF